MSVDAKDIWLDFTLGMGGFAEANVQMTHTSDHRKIRVRVPPGKLIPIVFLPGIMGSNLRLSTARQALIKRKDNRSWRPDDSGDAYRRRNASAAERQMRLDPDEVEVDRYYVTTDAGRFSSTGNETQTSDTRHDNVPNKLPDISPLLMSDPKPKPAGHPLIESDPQSFSAAQKARSRGWSEVMFGSYGDILKLLEARLNDIVRPEGNQQVVSPLWRNDQDKASPLGQNPGKFGASGAPTLTADELNEVSPCWYPVHAFGYNWLKSNGDEAKELAPRIKNLIATYNANGFDCPGVILVTHSMGGLLARALIHPDYGNLKDKVLGICHGVMPTHGAAAAYKRLRAGFEGSNKSWIYFLGRYVDNLIKNVLGGNGQEVTAVLANAQGGLELLPNPAYGPGWLKVQDQKGKVLMSWPKTSADGKPSEIDPAGDIYNKAPEQWWRVINPAWIDPAKQAERTKADGGKDKKDIGPKATAGRIRLAQEFTDAISETFADETYVHFGEDPDQKAWNELTWEVTDGDADAAGDPELWTMSENEPGDGTITVLTPSLQRLRLRLMPPSDAADGTVPVARSADLVKKVKLKFKQTGYDHQGSYQHVSAQAATLYSVVKIAHAYLPAWWAKKS